MPIVNLIPEEIGDRGIKEMGSIIDLLGNTPVQTMNLCVEIATGKIRSGMPEFRRFSEKKRRTGVRLLAVMGEMIGFARGERQWSVTRPDGRRVRPRPCFPTR